MKYRGTRTLALVAALWLCAMAERTAARDRYGDEPPRSTRMQVAPRAVGYDPFDAGPAEYAREQRTAMRYSRGVRTSYDEPLPHAEEYAEYQEELRGEWEGGYQPNYNGPHEAYDVFDDGAHNAIDGNHYRQPGGDRCTSGRACCDDACGGPCGGCGECSGFGAALLSTAYECGAWVRADYLLWWTKGEALPPLVTTSPDETPRLEAGVLGEPNTEILFGDGRYLNSVRSGGRIEFGAWLDECRAIGVGGGFFALGGGNQTFSDASEGEPIIARPFFNTLTDAQDSALTAYSSTATGDVIAGDILVRTSNELLNANAFLTRLLWRERGLRIDALGGYRFTRFDEDLSITENLVVTESGAFVPQGTTFDALDSFDVSNQFNGGDLGIKFESYAHRWSLDGMLKVALGGMQQQANVWGRTIVTVPGDAPDSREGDLLALPSNIGVYSRDKFAVVPELRLNLSYHITPAWRVNVGYTFIYWSEVLRAGEQVNTTLNTTQLMPPVVGPAVPTYSFVDGDLWAQGLNFGTELRF